MKGRFAIRVMTPLGEQATIAVWGPGDELHVHRFAGLDAVRVLDRYLNTSLPPIPSGWAGTAEWTLQVKPDS